MARTRHVAAYWGGTAFNWVTNRAAYITPERPDRFWFNNYIQSAQRFRTLARTPGLTSSCRTTPRFDGSKTKLPAMATRRAGDKHPYVVGTDSVSRYLTVAEECAKAGLAAREVGRCRMVAHDRVPPVRGKGLSHL